MSYLYDSGRPRGNVVVIPTIWLGLALSLLIHILVIWLWLPQIRALMQNKPDESEATSQLSVSLAPRVRVNCIAPGWIRTAWGAGASDVWQERVLRETPLRRWGTPEDIAWLTRFLVSDQAAYITGQVINANGGAIR